MKKKSITATATMFGYDGFKFLIFSPKATLKVNKVDAMRLAGVLLMNQKKFVMVNLKRYKKDLRELAALRKFLEPKMR